MRCGTDSAAAIAQASLILPLRGWIGSRRLSRGYVEGRDGATDEGPAAQMFLLLAA